MEKEVLPEEVKPSRIQSPSSINTYNQCPRKYYYVYIQKLPTSPSIHLVRGNIVHSVLEHFFSLDVTDVKKDECSKFFHREVLRLLLQFWNNAADKFEKLSLPQPEIQFYFEETVMMLTRWVNHVVERINKDERDNFVLIFHDLIPIREQSYRSEKYWLRGYIDAIEQLDGEVRIIDYKTSKSVTISKPYRLQLAIYALLYYEHHGRLPDKVGIHFLKGGLEFIDVDENLIALAKEEVEHIHLNTQSKEIKNYPRKTSPLCKWRSGQCDFYDVCFKQKGLDEY